MMKEMTYSTATRSEGIALSALMSKVYLWMTLALGITALTAFYVAGHPEMIAAIFSNQILFWGILIAELVIVGFMSARIATMSFPVAGALFGVYSILNGIIFSSIFLIYEMDVIAQTFVATAGTFGAMSLVGTFIKQDLSAVGRFLFFALIGLIVATVVNIFWASETFYWLITYAGVLIFAGLTAYDTQKIRYLMLTYSQGGDYETGMKMALLGSLTLYLDFINMFLYLLRIFGRRD